MEQARKRGVFLELFASSDFQGRAFVSSSSEWRTCGPRLQEHCRAHKDERWLLLDAEDRQRAFNDFVEQLKDAETAHKEEKRKKRCDAFRTLLDEEVSEASAEAYADLKWSSIDSLLRPKNDNAVQGPLVGLETAHVFRLARRENSGARRGASR